MTSHDVFQVVKDEILGVIDHWLAFILIAGHITETHEEHDKDCVEEGFSSLGQNCGGKGAGKI